MHELKTRLLQSFIEKLDEAETKRMQDLQPPLPPPPGPPPSSTTSAAPAVQGSAAPAVQEPAPAPEEPCGQDQGGGSQQHAESDPLGTGSAFGRSTFSMSVEEGRDKTHMFANAKIGTLPDQKGPTQHESLKNGSDAVVPVAAVVKVTQGLTEVGDVDNQVAFFCLQVRFLFVLKGFFIYIYIYVYTYIKNINLVHSFSL